MNAARGHAYPINFGEIDEDPTAAFPVFMGQDQEQDRTGLTNSIEMLETSVSAESLEELDEQVLEKGALETYHSRTQNESRQRSWRNPGAENPELLLERKHQGVEESHFEELYGELLRRLGEDYQLEKVEVLMNPSDGQGFENMRTTLHVKDPEDVPIKLGTTVRYDREEEELKYDFFFTQEGGGWTTDYLREINNESERYWSELTAS
jgi:hypothetical protein